LDHMLWLADTLMAKNRLETLKDIVREVARVTPADIRRVARQILDPQKFSLAIVGPLSDEQEKELRQQLQIVV
jgi:predicted Zn-dependent peptidase